MGRPLRIEYPAALYHITSRGNEKRDIFLEDSDRERFLELLEDYHDRFDLAVHCFVHMGNHCAKTSGRIEEDNEEGSEDSRVDKEHNIKSQGQSIPSLDLERGGEYLQVFSLAILKVYALIKRPLSRENISPLQK